MNKRSLELITSSLSAQQQAKVNPQLSIDQEQRAVIYIHEVVVTHEIRKKYNKWCWIAEVCIPLAFVTTP